MQMTVELVVVGVLGFVQGYVAVPFLIGLIEPCTRAIVPPMTSTFTKVVTRVCVFLSLLLTYFGIGIFWVRLLALGEPATSASHFKAWLALSFVGLLAYLMLARRKSRA